MIKGGQGRTKAFILSWLILLSLSIIPVFARDQGASNPKYIFYKGNTLYEDGKYDEAIEEYSKLLEQGLESGNLYYNLGNCYFKKGELGNAILNYERAKRLIPRDSDLKSNYKFALSQIKTSPATTSTSWFNKLITRSAIFTINEMTILLSCIYTITVIFLIIGIFVRKLRRYFYIVISLALLLIISIIIFLYGRISLLEKEAIVITENAEARFEPLDNATTHFILHEGTKIYIIHTKDDWIKVKRLDGKIGWIKKDRIEKI
jgi:tetratricopeptide (TPR) repeat protein